MYNTNIYEIFQGFFNKIPDYYFISCIVGGNIHRGYAGSWNGALLAALISGVPINKIKIIFIGFNPGLKMPGGLSSNSVTLINYAGGAFAAFVCLCAYIFLWLRRFRARPSLLTWIVGLIILGLCGEEIGNSLVEGHFHAAYLYNANSTLPRLLW